MLSGKWQGPEQSITASSTRSEVGKAKSANVALTMDEQGRSVQIIRVEAPDLLEAAELLKQATDRLHDSLHGLETVTLELKDTLKSLNQGIQVR